MQISIVFLQKSLVHDVPVHFRFMSSSLPVNIQFTSGSLPDSGWLPVHFRCFHRFSNLLKSMPRLSIDIRDIMSLLQASQQEYGSVTMKNETVPIINSQTHLLLGHFCYITRFTLLYHFPTAIWMENLSKFPEQYYYLNSL